MNLSTMAAVMSFISRLEGESAEFYEGAADKFPELKDDFRAWAKENRKFEKQIKQTYFGVITDTLESNYCFEGLTTEEFEFDSALPEGADAAAAKAKAGEIERNIVAFYTKAAGMSEGLMADVPRVLKKVAQKKENRLASL